MNAATKLPIKKTLKAIRSAQASWIESERIVASTPTLPARRAHRMREMLAAHVAESRELMGSVDAAIAYLEWQATIGRERNTVLIDVLRRMVGPCGRFHARALLLADLASVGGGR